MKEEKNPYISVREAASKEWEPAGLTAKRKQKMGLSVSEPQSCLEQKKICSS